MTGTKRGSPFEMRLHPNASDQESFRDTTVDLITASELIVADEIFAKAMMERSLPRIIHSLQVWLSTIDDPHQIQGALNQYPLQWRYKDWGSRVQMAERDHGTHTTVAKALFITPGRLTSRHMHANRTELHVPVMGIKYRGAPVAEILVGNFRALYVPAGVEHRFCGVGTSDGVILSLHVQTKEGR